MTKTSAKVLNESNESEPETPPAQVEVVVVADVFMWGVSVPNQQRDHHSSQFRGWRGKVPREAAERGLEVGALVLASDVDDEAVEDELPVAPIESANWASMVEADVLAHLNQHPEDAEAISEFEMAKDPKEIRENVVVAADVIIESQNRR